MGFGLPESVADSWFNYDEESFFANYSGDGEGVVYFVNLPEWAYDEDKGPFWVDTQTNLIYSASLRPSQKGDVIGALTFQQ
jgi:hypothetical protein